MTNKKTALVLGGGGFIGGHLAKRLKEEGYWVRIVDIKREHEFWDHKEICNDYVSGDLRDPQLVSRVFKVQYNKVRNDSDEIIYNYSHHPIVTGKQISL